MTQQLLVKSPEKTRQHVAHRKTSPASAQSYQGGLHPILQLQRMLGNRRVAQLIQAKQLTLKGKILSRRRKPSVGAAGDHCEQEADRVPRNVVEIGNRGVTLVIQRDKGKGDGKSDSLGIPLDKLGIPTRGPEVRAELATRLPGLLGALTDDQLEQWQRVVDYYYIEPKVGRALGNLRAEYEGRHGGFWHEQPGYRRTAERLRAALPKYTKADEKLEVDVRLLLSDDVSESPEWDVEAELAFRQWAVGQLTKAPIELRVRPTASWYEALGQWPMPVKNTKGFITADDLRREYSKEYEQQVSHRPLIAKLQQALDETQQVFNEVVPEHLWRSEKNKYSGTNIGPFWARHFSELLGKGSAPYPTIDIWQRPKALLAQARPLLEARQIEVAAPMIAMAEQATAECAQRFLAYEERVMTGAATAVKWLNRLKTAGSVAAGIASGGLGLTGSALVAGGYTLVQEGAGRLSEMAHGQRKHFGVASLIEEAGVSAVMSMMGGALQARFQTALKARLDKVVPGLAGKSVVDASISAAAAGTSSVYLTATELALRNIVQGKALPKSAAEFADLVVDNALQNVVMDVGLRKINSRVATEYEAWKSGKAKPAVAVSGTATPIPGKAADPATTAKMVEDAPRRLPEDAVRALLKEGGGWERLRAELEAGTGLGANLVPAERRALIDRFEAHREVLARNVGSVFGGDVVIADSPAGRQIEVQFTGADGAKHVTQAQDYLDAKSPGWAEHTAVKLTAPTAPESSRAVRVAEALGNRLTPSVRHLAEQFVPIYEQWSSLRTPEARFEALLEIVNKPLVAAGAPPLLPNFLHKPRPEQYGKLTFEVWELHINRDLVSARNPTPEQFAEAIDTMAHEARHALQWFRMARLNPDAVRGSIDPQAIKAAREANQGLRRAERFDPGQLKYQEAQAFYESVYGAGRARREQIYEDKKNRLVERDVAYDELQRLRNLPLNDPARRAAEEQYRQALEKSEQAHEEYEYLVEEIDARRHGQAVATVVRERLADLRALEQAKARHRDAYAELSAAEKKALLPGRPANVEKRKQDREEAFRRYEATAAIVKRLQDKLAAAAGKKAGKP